MKTINLLNCGEEVPEYQKYKTYMQYFLPISWRNYKYNKKIIITLMEGGGIIRFFPIFERPWPYPIGHLLPSNLITTWLELIKLSPGVFQNTLKCRSTTYCYCNHFRNQMSKSVQNLITQWNKTLIPRDLSNLNIPYLAQTPKDKNLSCSQYWPQIRLTSTDRTFVYPRLII